MNIRNRLVSFLPSIAVIAAGLATTSRAATIYYDGGGTTTTGIGWGTISAWSTDATGTTDPAAAPIASDDVIFSITGATAGVVGMNAARAANSMTFSSSVANTLMAHTTTTTANSLTIGAGGVTINAGAGAVTFGVSTRGILTTTLGASQAWTNNSANAMTVIQPVNLQANTLTLAGTGAGNIAITGKISGVGGAVILNRANSSMDLNTTNDFTGGFTLNAGTITNIGSGTYSGFGTGTFTASNGTLNFVGGSTQTINNNLSWGGGNLILTRSAGGTPNTTWAGTLSLTGNQTLTLGASTTANNSTFTGDISGSGTLTVAGPTAGANLTISGNNTAFSGGLTLNSANVTLRVGSATALGTGTLTLNSGTIQSSDATARTISNPVTIGGNFTVGGTGNMTFSNTGASALGATRQITVNSGINATFAQAFSGAGAGITKAGAGTLTLTGNNTFTGTTTINAGTVVLNNDGDVTGSAVTFGASNTGLTVTGGSGVTSIWNAGGGNIATGNGTYNNIQVLIDGAGTAGSARVTNVGTLVWGRTATNSTITLTNGGQMNVNGEVRIGNPYYSETGGANLTIGGGTATSTFTGTASASDFYIGYGERTGSKNNVVTVSSGGVLTGIRDMVVGHVFDAQNNANPSTNNQLLVTGTGTASMRGISLGFANASSSRTANANIVSVTSGGTLTSTGAILIGRANLAGSQSNSNTMTVSGTGSTWNASNQNVTVGSTNNATAISNNNILTVGAGAVVSNVAALTVGSGAGTETGNELVVNGSLSATTVSVSSGNFLKGSGTITGAVTVNSGGFHAAGNSIGTQNVVGSYTQNGTEQVELGTPGATPVLGLSDLTNVTGGLTLGGASVLQLIDNAGANGQGSAGAGAYRIIDYTTSLTGTFSSVTNPLSLLAQVVYNAGDTAVDLNLLDHGNASFANPTNTDTLTVNIGSFTENTGSYNSGFNLYNLLQTAGFTADIALTGIALTTPDATPLSTNLALFSNLAAGSSNAYLATLNTVNPVGVYSEIYKLTFGDAAGYVGANVVQELFLTIEGTIVPVPEPSSLAMLAFGMMTMWLFRKKKV